MIENIYNTGNLSYQIGSPGSCTPGTPQADSPPQQGAQPTDRVTLSEDAIKAQGTSNSEEYLKPEDKQQVNQLKKRDAEVKAHEQAHMAAGGGLVQGGASYQYQRGPDGKMYAVGGEVKIDTSPERTPQGTIRKMQQVKRAALAPAQPSGTDRAVAARAAQVEAQARAELSKSEETDSGGEDNEQVPQATGNIPGEESKSPYAATRPSTPGNATETGRHININI